MAERLTEPRSGSAYEVAGNVQFSRNGLVLWLGCLLVLLLPQAGGLAAALLGGGGGALFLVPVVVLGPFLAPPLLAQLLGLTWLAVSRPRHRLEWSDLAFGWLNRPVHVWELTVSVAPFLLPAGLCCCPFLVVLVVPFCFPPLFVAAVDGLDPLAAWRASLLLARGRRLKLALWLLVFLTLGLVGVGVIGSLADGLQLEEELLLLGYAVALLPLVALLMSFGLLMLAESDRQGREDLSVPSALPARSATATDRQDDDGALLPLVVPAQSWAALGWLRWLAWPLALPFLALCALPLPALFLAASLADELTGKGLDFGGLLGVSAVVSALVIPNLGLLALLVYRARTGRAIRLDEEGVLVGAQGDWPGERIPFGRLAGFRVREDGLALIQADWRARLAPILVRVSGEQVHQLVVELERRGLCNVDG